MSDLESPSVWPRMVKELSRATSNRQLARLIGVDPKEIGRWINGKAVPRGDNRDALKKECDRVGLNWRKFERLVPVYDFRELYERNVANGPQGIHNVETHIPEIPTRLWNYELNSPLGLPASVLTLNADWIAPLSRLGFDIITAKTVRTRKYVSHVFPNICYLPHVQSPFMIGHLPATVRGTVDISTANGPRASLGNSFGMPSANPDEWQADFAKAKGLLQPGQILIASVVGTAESGDSQSALVDDFVRCAQMANEVGPDAIELNFSCPNVYGREGLVFHDPTSAEEICKRVADATRGTPILIKVGFLSPDELTSFFEATNRYVNGYTAINTIGTKIVSDGQIEEPVFPGKARASGGVSGIAIRDHAVEMVRRLRALAGDGDDFVILGVGGISTAEDVELFRSVGASAVQICTAAILNPYIAIEIRNALARVHPAYQSGYLVKAGLNIRFKDANTAEAFDTMLRVAQRKGVLLEVALHALKVNWLDSYVDEIARATQPSGSPQRTRRQAPSEKDMEHWILHETNSRKPR